MKNTLINILGWYGVAAIVAAFALLSFEVITADSIAYPVLNMTGAAGIIISSSFKRDWQPVVLNTFWLIIAVIGLIKAWS